MNNIYLQYLRLKDFILDNTSIRQRLFFGVLTVILLVIYFVAGNHAVKVWAGVCSGLSFGIFLIKFQPVINYLKNTPSKRIN